MKESTTSQFPWGSACLSPGLQALYPAGVIAAEMREPGEPSSLYPEEAEYVRRAVPKRVQEFAAGRACARRALAEVGIDDFVLHMAPDRRPLWPDSVIGSITHTTGFCAAVAARRSHLMAIGIDSEVVGKASPDIWSTICGPEETAWHSSLSAHQQAAAVTLLFSAKEAFYKCQYPLTGEWLDFHDLYVEPLDWGMASASFVTRATRPREFEKFAAGPIVGRYLFHEGFVTAAVVF